MRLFRNSFFTVAITVCFPLSAAAQFNIPLPPPFTSKEVRADDFQTLFLLLQAGKTEEQKRAALLSELDASRANPARSKSFAQSVDTFCASLVNINKVDCASSLDLESLEKRFRENKPLIRIYFAGLWPPRRSVLAQYMQRNGNSEAFSFASQFAANVSANEAYVVSNIVRGLTGRAIFSTDYAAVVTRSSEKSAEKRDTVESDKANALRAINNGGTLVGRFSIPLLASAGITNMGVLGVTLSAGLIGPISETDESKRKGVASGAIEGIGSVAIRSLAGDSEQTAELIYGARVGYTVADGSLFVNPNGFHDVAFGQAIVGLRQNGKVSVSALVTIANHGTKGLLPKLVLNFSAAH